MGIHYNAKETSGNWNSDAAGTDKNGTAVQINNNKNVKKVGISAHIVVDAETDTITITGRWQISPDNTTFADAVGPHNPANVIIATGTSGADAAVTKDITAPDAVNGARWARFVLVNGVVTGNTADTFAIGYNWIDAGFGTF